MGKRHLTPREIIAQCKVVARERRMTDRAAWTAMGIICAYAIMQKEGFKGKRISFVASRVNEMEAEWQKGNIDLKAISKKLFDKAGWTVEWQDYTEKDITARKGTYKYWLDLKQIEPQNAINEYATRYMLFFFTSLMEKYGFGKERLTRIEDYMWELLLKYQTDKDEINTWIRALYEEAGVVMEMPVDPLTQTVGSVMTGM